MIETIKMPTAMNAAVMFALKPSLESLARNGDDIIVDLSDVSFIDSSGVGGLAFLCKRLQGRGHTLGVIGAHGQPLALLEHLRLNALLAPAVSQTKLVVNAAERELAPSGARLAPGLDTLLLH
jgi:anti-sigma B factor antagonist